MTADAAKTVIIPGTVLFVLSLGARKRDGGRAGGQLLEAIRFARCTVHVLAFASSVRILLCSPYVVCGVYAYWCIVSGEGGYDGNHDTNHGSQLCRVSLVHHEIREARDGVITAPLSQGRLL